MLIAFGRLAASSRARFIFSEERGGGGSSSAKQARKYTQVNKFGAVVSTQLGVDKIGVSIFCIAVNIGELLPRDARLREIEIAFVGHVASKLKKNVMYFLSFSHVLCVCINPKVIYSLSTSSYVFSSVHRCVSRSNLPSSILSPSLRFHFHFHFQNIPLLSPLHHGHGHPQNTVPSMPPQPLCKPRM